MWILRGFRPMRYLAILTLFLSACYPVREYAVARGHSATPDLTSLVGEVIPGVVQVYSVNERSEGVSRGSGVVIRRDSSGSLILTARHMTEGDGIATWVVRKNGVSAEARCLKRGVGPEEDWALLETVYPVGDAVPILEPGAFGDSVKPYEPCVAVGYALGWNTLTVTLGHVQEVAGDRVRMSAPIIFGNSGGGLFVTHDGRLWLAGITVAVGTSGMTVAEHMGISVGIPVIRRRGGLSR